MYRIILREILILVLSLAVFPTTVILLLAYNDSLNVGLAFFGRMIAGGIGPGGTSLTLWVKLFSPYLVLQASGVFSGLSAVLWDGDGRISIFRSGGILGRALALGGLGFV